MHTSAPTTHAAPGLARVEDERLLRGQGTYVSDLQPAGVLHAAFVRSMHASASALAVDASMAVDAPGVVAVFTGADLAGLQLPAPNPQFAVQHRPDAPLLAQERLCYVGQPVAVVIAQSAQAAQQAAEQVMVDCEPEDVDDAASPNSPVCSALHLQGGSFAADGGAATVRVDVEHSQARVVALSLEPRSILAQWSAVGDTPGLAAPHALTVWMGTQTPARSRADIASTLGLNAEQVRVVAPDVGGAFGAKSSMSLEDLVVCWAARALEASVRWVASRSEEFTSGMHGRGGALSASLWLDAEGRFTQLQADLQFAVGAWLPYSAVVPSRNAARILPGPYRVGAVDIRSRTVQTPTAPVTIYRGAGRPEAALLMERLVERAARASGVDPLELRLRNLVAASAMPYSTPTGEVLDAGDYAAALQLAAQRFDYAEQRSQQAARRAAGECVGVGTALYIEPCGQGWESARVTLHADGRAQVASGSCSQGQGHRSSFAAIAAEALGLSPADVQVSEGDTGTDPQGVGALASRSMAIGGSAVLQACQEVLRQREAGASFPITVEQRYTAPQEAWSYGCVMVRVRVDAETGQTQVERVVWVDDAGRVISPQLAQGQMLGGLAQGLGQALMERMVYDDTGQLLTGSLMDYAVPRAHDMPEVELHSLHSPTTANALGAKGIGEAGCIGVPAAVLNAVADALSPWGEVELDFPLTSERVWQAMQRLRPH